MASAFHDSAHSESGGSGTTIANADALAVTVGDLVDLDIGWEGATAGSVITDIDDGQGNTLVGGQITVISALLSNANGDLRSARYKFKATNTGTITITATWDVARPFRSITAISVTPSASTELIFDAGAQAQGSSSSPSAGSASSTTTSGFAIATVRQYGTRTATEGSGWTLPAELATLTDGSHAEHRVVSATGSITGDMTLNAANEYVAHLVIYKEQATGGAPFELVAEQPIVMTGTLGISAALDIVTAQILVPASDVSAGSWSPSSGVDLYAMLDEADPSDSDYILTSTLGDECIVALQAGSDPFVSTGHVVRYRLRGDGSSGITVALLQGASLIASWTHDPAPSTFTTFEQTLSGGEADSITDYTALRLRFTEV